LVQAKQRYSWTTQSCAASRCSRIELPHVDSTMKISCTSRAESPDQFLRRLPDALLQE
jgi:hypothetical protein